MTASEGPVRVPAPEKPATASSPERMERLQHWLAIAANLGVLGGLVLVALQMSQNTELARKTYVSEGNVIQNQIWAAMTGPSTLDLIAKSVASPDELTHAEFLAVDAYLFPSVNMIYRDYRLAQEGLYTEAEWKSSVDLFVQWYLANPFGNAWWQEVARDFFPPEFSGYVDQRLGATPARDHHSYYEAVRARVRDR